MKQLFLYNRFNMYHTSKNFLQYKNFKIFMNCLHHERYGSGWFLLIKQFHICSPAIQLAITKVYINI